MRSAKSSLLKVRRDEVTRVDGCIVSQSQFDNGPPGSRPIITLQLSQHNKPEPLVSFYDHTVGGPGLCVSSQKQVAQQYFKKKITECSPSQLLFEVFVLALPSHFQSSTERSSISSLYSSCCDQLFLVFGSKSALHSLLSFNEQSVHTIALHDTHYCCC